MARRLLVLTTALFALGATSASAATIYVPTGTGCDQTSPTLQGAIVLAAGTPAVRDTIRLTAGDFTQNAVVGGQTRSTSWEPVGVPTAPSCARPTAASRSTSSRRAAPCRTCAFAWRTRP